MSIVFDTEQQALRDASRQFFSEQFSSENVRVAMSTPEGYDTKVWLRMASELGLQGLAIADELGGGGAGFTEQLVVFEELGKALAGSPYYSTIGLAANTISASGSGALQDRLLSSIAEGNTIATTSYLDSEGRIDLKGSAVNAVDTGSGWSLNGGGYYVTDGHVADILIAIAATVDGPTLFAAPADSPGVTAQQLETLDPTRKQAHLTFTNAPAEVLGAAGSGYEVLDHALDLARVALACEQLGGAQSCLDAAVEYASVRVQFGRKIGSFQAIKHRCADILTAVEIARSAIYHAVSLASDPETVSSQSLKLAAPMAKALASEAYLFAARQNIQIHGGIGCTWEHDAHLHYRRAHSSNVLLGDINQQRDLVATRLGI